MLRLDINKQKQLTFEIQIGGVQYDQLTSHFKVVIGEIEYGFPAKVGREQVTVDLPPLKDIIALKIQEGEQVEIVLEMIADGKYLTPWKDKAVLSNPMIIEAKIKDPEFEGKPALETRLVVEESGAKQTTIVEEKKQDNTDIISESLVDKLAEKLAKMLNIKEQDEEPPSPEKEEEDEVEESCGKVHKEEKKIDTVEEDIKDKSKALEKILNKKIDTFNLAEGKEKKSMTIQEFKQNLSEDDIFKYMTRKGTKNPEVQKIVFEKAKKQAKKDEPVYILKEVVNILKKE